LFPQKKVTPVKRVEKVAKIPKVNETTSPFRIPFKVISVMWAVEEHLFNQSAVAAIRCYSATKPIHKFFSGVFTSIRLPWTAECFFNFFQLQIVSEAQTIN
jgi:hypothetical protein